MPKLKLIIFENNQLLFKFMGSQRVGRDFSRLNNFPSLTRFFKNAFKIVQIKFNTFFFLSIEKSIEYFLFTNT